ncbi:CAP domain-containing protein [Phaeobacter sp. J2-8]|uniref:CAP domain-containing protein n=1 Tax=Phaeobacter sp. J2-8 TaxID=2931394 RepID=UPI001FD236FD|nr:CAP domain-containing protein [Phaeobacter sp. J2-8]MCJ7874806.1 CAP domain-containing protein [Phaeobacter sp. J2-8]
MQHTPTNFEQAMLETINRARISPEGEFDRLIADAQAGTGVQSNITNAIRFFGVDLEALRSQLADLDPVAPLAWNTALATSADTHGQLVIDTDTQSHRLPGEARLLDRVEDAGYENLSRVGENVYAYTSDPLHGHAGFMIDWGYDDEDYNGDTRYDDWNSRGDGIQDPAGHRNTIMSANYVDIGISALSETDADTRVGPWVVTHNFGATHGSNPPQLVGVFLDDADGDRFYDIGEGQGGITVTATGSAGAFVTTTWGSGGYQMELPPAATRYSFRVRGWTGWRNTAP